MSCQMFPETSGSFLGTLSLLDKVISRTHSEGSLRTILLTLKKKNPQSRQASNLSSHMEEEDREEKEKVILFDSSQLGRVEPHCRDVAIRWGGEL